MNYCVCINQSIIVRTSKTKSLLSSLYKREVEVTLREDSLREFPLFGKEGVGEIFTTICLFNDGLVNTNALNKMTSPPPSPSPLEGEGWVGGKRNYCVCISKINCLTGCLENNFPKSLPTSLYEREV